MQVQFQPKQPREKEQNMIREVLEVGVSCFYYLESYLPPTLVGFMVEKLHWKGVGHMVPSFQTNNVECSNRLRRVEKTLF